MNVERVNLRTETKGNEDNTKARKQEQATIKNKSRESKYSFGFYGAGGRTRTGTLSPAVDFESTTSTIPSHRQVCII